MTNKDHESVSRTTAHQNRLTKNQDNVDHQQTKDILDNRSWNGVTLALHVFLPIAGLVLFWGRRDLFGKILMQIDRSCVSVFCPSFSKRERLLKWASGRLPSTWSSHTKTLSGGLVEFWRDGSLLCTLINSAVAGACPNPHRHWNKPMSHGQALAYKYLGVVPVFTENDFADEKLSVNQERNLIQYLHKIQQAIGRLTEKEEKCHTKYSTQYVARGMGLFTGEQHRKTLFYIYANVNCKKFSNIIISIKGPYNTFGRMTIAPFHIAKNGTIISHDIKITKQDDLAGYKSEAQNSFLKTISVDLKRMINTVDNVSECDIPIETEFEEDRVRVTFIPKNSGIYELCIVSDGLLLKGSPFNVHVTRNVCGTKDNFRTDHTKKVPKDSVANRKILSRVIDFIDEKLVVKNNFNTKPDETLKIIPKKYLENIEEDTFTSDDEVADINQNLVSFKPEKDTNDCTCTKDIDLETNTCDEGFSDCSSSYEYEIKNKIKIFQEHILKNTTQTMPQVSNRQLQNTSPICQNHIALEVDEIKPKLNARLTFNNITNDNSLQHQNLMQQNSLNTDETSSVLSENESDVGSESSSLGHEVLYRCGNQINQKQNTNLNVLNVLNTLKQKNERYFDLIKKNTNCDSVKSCSFEYKLRFESDNNFKCSLPNLVCDEERQFKKWSSTMDISNLNFRERVEYWNRVCSQNNLDQDKKIDNRKVTTTIEATTKKVSKSTENVFRSNSLNKSREKLDFSYSIEENLDDRMFLSVKERKALLLEKMQREQEESTKENTLPKIQKSVKIIETSKNVPTKTISDCSSNRAIIPKPPSNGGKASPNGDSDRRPKRHCAKPPPNDRNRIPKGYFATKLDEMKQRFKLNQKYFKQLEDRSSAISDLKELKRRHSFDCDTKLKKKENLARTNSLCFPKVSERFYVENLYNDVIVDKKMLSGRFKGSANSKAVANALASMQAVSDQNNLADLEESDLKFNIFVKKKKIRHRESVKSLFDVNY